MSYVYNNVPYPIGRRAGLVRCLHLFYHILLSTLSTISAKSEIWIIVGRVAIICKGLLRHKAL